MAKPSPTLVFTLRMSRFTDNLILFIDRKNHEFHVFPVNFDIFDRMLDQENQSIC